MKDLLLLNLVLLMMVRCSACRGWREGSSGGRSCLMSQRSRLLRMEPFFSFLFRLLLCLGFSAILARLGWLSSAES